MKKKGGAWSPGTFPSKEITKEITWKKVAITLEGFGYLLTSQI